MRLGGTILCAVPPACFEEAESERLSVELLRRFFEDAATLERRLSKNVAINDERMRYARLCGQIEQVALSNAVFGPTRGAFAKALRQGSFPALRIGDEYVGLLRAVHLRTDSDESAASGRLGASLFSPSQLVGHVPEFERAAETLGFAECGAIRDRLWFLRKRVVPAGCGLVEVPDPLGASRTAAQAALAHAADGRSLWERFWGWLWRRQSPQAEHGAPLLPPLAGATPTAAQDWMRYGEPDRGSFMEQRLRAQIEQALAQGTPVNLNNQRHNMATQVLSEFVHRREGEPAGCAHVAYDEGRVARPFPLRCLTPLPDGWFPTREFHIGLVSMRHLAIDQYIDINWYRNVEMGGATGLSDADEAAFAASMQQFRALLTANAGERLRLRVYHTGFVPAVIGFYRALVTTLASGQHPLGCLQVVPMLQPLPDGSYAEGAAWPR